MKLSSRALLNRLFFAPKAAWAQSVTGLKQAATTQVEVESDASDENFPVGLRGAGEAFFLQALVDEGVDGIADCRLPIAD